MHKLKNILQSWPMFLVLLPFFFVFHGYVGFFNAIEFSDMMKLIFYYYGITLIVFLLTLLFYRNLNKAALISFLIMSIEFFFGPGHDLLKKIFAHSFLSSYSFVLSLLLIIVIVTVIFLKRKSVHPKLINYLNILILVLLLADGITLIGKAAGKKDIGANSIIHINCDSCIKPDIYLLLFDEYSSSHALKTQWNYNNSELDSFLLEKKFSLQENSSSNYNFTPFSMASALNMRYLNIPDPEKCNIDDYNNCFALIKNNTVCQTLESIGYHTINYSIFDLKENPSIIGEDFLPLKTKLLTAQTLTERIKKDLSYHLLTGPFKMELFVRDLLYVTERNNNKIIEATIEETKKTVDYPRFVYSHIEMPHAPYYYNHNKKLSENELIETYKDINSVSAYLNYIPQTNKVLKKIVNNIFQNNKRPFVIILLGDHGFRNSIKTSFHFSNLNAVYTGGIPIELNENGSNVNLFTSVFNGLFHTSLPLIKDSTIFLKDK